MIKKQNIIIWQIKKIEDVYKLLKLTNKYYRTPKYEAVVRAIKWINNYIIWQPNINSTQISGNKTNYINNLNKYNLKKREDIISKINIIEVKPLDNTEILSNAWLAGFTDADGNFSINLNQSRLKSSVNLSYRLEIRQNYHRSNIYNIDSSYYSIMLKIASIFNSNLYSRERLLKLRKQNNSKLYYSYIVSINSIKNLKLVNDYFKQYPLLSSKNLNYLDWSKLIELIKKHNGSRTHPDCYNLGLKIHNNFNSKRKIYNWDHLYKSIYFK